MTRRIELGRLGRAVGLRGQVRLNCSADFWPASLDSSRLRRVDRRGEQAVRITDSRSAAGGLVVSFEDVTSREGAEALKDALLVLAGELDVPAPEQPRPFQVVGFKVRYQGGDELGTVSGLDAGPAQPLLRVRGASKEYSIPWVEAIIRGVDWQEGWIEVDPPAGLLDL